MEPKARTGISPGAYVPFPAVVVEPNPPPHTAGVGVARWNRDLCFGDFLVVRGEGGTGPESPRADRPEP